MSFELSTATFNEFECLKAQLAALAGDNSYPVTKLSNLAALLGMALPKINWIGFYVVDPIHNCLRLAPFFGKPACTLIRFGQVVCGTAWAENKVMRVDDVSLFPGHIACDCHSRSELVLPLYNNGKIVGVLDIDSPEIARFSNDDVQKLEEAASIISSNVNDLNKLW